MKAKQSVQQLTEMNEHELSDKFHELNRELFNLRFQSATAQLSSPARFKTVRREIARLKTIAKMRKLAIG
jgi:large subunit ribosomal protein L29